MPDEIRRQAIARDLARQHQLCGIDELRVIDLVTGRLLAHRERHGPLDLADTGGLVDRLGAGITRGDILDSAVSLIARELAAEDAEREQGREAARVEMLGERVRDGVRSEHFAHCVFVPDPDQPQSGFCSRDGFTMESHCLQCYREHRRVRIVPTGTTSIMDADPATKAKALDQMEQECRRLTIEIEREFAPDQQMTRVGGPEPYEVEIEEIDDDPGPHTHVLVGTSDGDECVVCGPIDQFADLAHELDVRGGEA